MPAWLGRRSGCATARPTRTDRHRPLRLHRRGRGVTRPVPASRYLPDEAATLAFGRELAELLNAAEGYNRDAIVYLQGGLGAGKTTLVRGILRA
ncbi:MAG: tRNA (adenosine(37)-N6)-threonylcarbamoyltransferase complex ATPase subunit type 1 TsaE, partial [Gammaproteobacteria bacterium]|nr:tRNA (adenosine(37)-N6)-threonylcarbamoyltransferase complex ATPase subunit type 1 TsaE [Gammaproteobacteria bacterium]